MSSAAFLAMAESAGGERYATWTLMSGLTARAPAVKPASDFSCAGIRAVPMKPISPVFDVSAAAAPTRKEPCCSLNRMPTTFGAFISLLPGKDGLLHISEVRKLVGGKRIDNVDDVVKVGQKIQVELKEIDPRGKLSLAAVLPEGEADAKAESAETAKAEEPADA